MPQPPVTKPVYRAVGGRTVWVTLDDGPHPSRTSQILSALGRHGVKAVFFVVGTNAKAQPSLLRDISGAGHLIGNHTWDHPDLSRLSASAFRDQLERTRDVISQYPGGTTLFRPPYGAHNATVDKVVSQLGYRSILWSVDTLDWNKSYKPDKWIQHGLDQIRNRTSSLVLAHAIQKTTAAHFDAFLSRISSLSKTAFGAPQDI